MQNKVDEIRKSIELLGTIQQEDKSEPAAWSVAYHLSEIFESAHKIEIDLVQDIVRAKNSEEVKSVILNIELELRHLIYHVNRCVLFPGLVLSTVESDVG